MVRLIVCLCLLIIYSNYIFAEILHLNATDVDEDHNLNFSLNTVECEDESGNNLLPSYCNGYFNIDTIHEVGVLSLIKELDRETIERFTLTIEVIDMNAVNVFGSQNALKTISILVLDINDNSPVFISTPQSFSVNEGVEASAFVGQVTATDPDKGDNGTVTYTVTGNYSDYFTLSNTNPTKGQLSTLKVIDRETVGDVLNITIVASDEGIPSPRFTSIVVAVKINDINDNSPIYTQTNYSTAIAETVQFPDHVITVHADDLDSLEKGFGEIMYTIIRGDDYSQFAMNHTTGEITVAQGKNFDREAKAEYVLTVEASDDRGQTGSHKTTVEVKIKIDDFNDCPPQFTQDIYRVSFREDGEVGDSVGTVSAEDLDVGENSKIKYSIVGGNDDGHFRISESSGEVALLKSIRNKESKYLLTINATDNGTVPLSSMCQMQIDVIDANINFPEFQNIEFGQEIFLAENSPTQELVFQVIASDKDRGENGHVHFILLNNLDNFQIGYESGNITLLSNMDRETTERYALNIMAEDGGNPPRSEETQLIIVVTDVDDNPPFYLPDSNTQFISVEEEKSPFTIEIPVLGAQDKDLPENTQNYYFIVGGTGVGNFSLDKETRFLTTLIKFDHEQTDSYDLIVKASNDPEYLANNRQRKNIAWNPDDNSLLHVICTITDINDNLPVFTKEIYETDVPFDTQPDPDITIIQVWATDIDTGLAEVPTYSIKSSMWVLHGNSFNRSGTFGIQPSRDNTKGDIYLASAIDGDQDGKYELIIRATDSNLKHVAETTVSIGIVKADETVILYSRYTPSEFESMEDEFVADMEALLHAKVYLDKVIQHNKQNSLYQEAESDIYFHAKNGTYLIPKQEIIAILGQKESYPVLGEYGIVGNGEVATEEVDRTEDYLKATAIILGAVLGVAIVIFTIAICCMRQSYKRKLKVKEAAEQTSHDMEDIQEGRGSSHVPNTNVFNSNPLHEIKESQQGIQLDWQLTRESRDDDDDDSIDDNAVESNDSAIGENLDQEEDEPVDNQFDIDFDPKGGANNAQLAAALNAANRRMGGENLTFIFDDEVANGNTAL
nr:cadherin EGF LAG seven-pass G-type receptor 2-like [Ciona intestinalis]|eukprot:XP_009857749.2 cadherin EGF LAG seven-pass G-type receptor 2-like [Ciona intestinalis]